MADKEMALDHGVGEGSKSIASISSLRQKHFIETKALQIYHS